MSCHRNFADVKPAGGVDNLFRIGFRPSWLRDINALSLSVPIDSPVSLIGEMSMNRGLCKGELMVSNGLRQSCDQSLAERINTDLKSVYIG